jgi:sugar O-acyltransferase (sialic acid O-acetyltransferase NeuD family)
MPLYGIVGAGGFGREVLPVAQQMLNTMFADGTYELVFVTEQQPSEKTVNQHPVLTVEEFFAHTSQEKFFNIAISDFNVRKRIAEMMQDGGAIPFQINALNRVELTNNQIAEGAIFCPFTTVTSNAIIGKFFHANIYSYVAHDCVIGDYVTFAPNVHCNGNVVIEDNVYVGTGVIIKQGTPHSPVVIGKGAVLGMGAVVTKNVPPGETVVGNPAKIFHKVAPSAVMTK